MFGPELHYIYRKFRPYGDFMIGPGNITYHSGQTDNSIVYELGGGVDYHKNRTLNFRMIDFQYQFWDLGNHYYPPGLLPGAARRLHRHQAQAVYSQLRRCSSGSGERSTLRLLLSSATGPGAIRPYPHQPQTVKPHG